MRTNKTVTGMVILCAAVAALAVTITIDETTQYQTIDGFGALGAKTYESPYHDAAFVDMAINDLGLTVLRTMLPGTTERRAYWRDMKAEADARGEPLKVISSCWTPPASMKTNGSEVQGSLKPDSYDDYAHWVVQFIGEVKQQCGIDLYGVSLQNEPAFANPFVSCFYTAEQYRDMVKVAGPIIHASYPNVKLVGPEDMLGRWTAGYPGAVVADPVSREHMDILAVHGYTDGVHPTSASDAVSKWKQAARNTEGAGKGLWMTETSGYSTDWNGAFGLAESIYAALKYGHIGAWVWWALSFNSTHVEGLTVSGQPTSRYYISKNFYRYIRPGAVMIDAIPDNDLVFAVAFRHTANETLTLVLLNASGSEQSVTLTGNALPASMSRYLTTSSVNCADQGTVGTSGITLPASSITTLQGGGYTPATAVASPKPAAPAVRPLPVGHDGAAFDLTGRRCSSQLLSAGLRVVRTTTGATRVRVK